MLGYYGVEVTHIVAPSPMPRADVSIICGINTWKVILKVMILPGKKVLRFMGTDGFRLSSRRLTRFVVHLLAWMGVPIVYASKELGDVVGLKGETLITPIDTRIFRPLPDIERDLDVLYYCPEGREEIYRLDLLEEYMRAHPDESVTLIDDPVFSPTQMSHLYHQHKKFFRWTTHDANPKMPHEAFMCGCESWENDRQITEVPEFMLMENAIPRWIEYLEGLIDRTGWRRAGDGWEFKMTRDEDTDKRSWTIKWRKAEEIPR